MPGRGECTADAALDTPQVPPSTEPRLLQTASSSSSLDAESELPLESQSESEHDSHGDHQGGGSLGSHVSRVPVPRPDLEEQGPRPGQEQVVVSELPTPVQPDHAQAVTPDVSKPAPATKRQKRLKPEKKCIQEPRTEKPVATPNPAQTPARSEGNVGGGSAGDIVARPPRGVSSLWNPSTVWICNIPIIQRGDQKAREGGEGDHESKSGFRIDSGLIFLSVCVCVLTGCNML